MGNVIRQRVAAHLTEAAELLGRVRPDDVAAIAELIVGATAEGRTVFVIGNGGSAATADHFATDLGKNASHGGRRVRAISLASNTALLTALANDLGYARVFAEQIESLGRAGDVLVAISGSGNSPNIVEAVTMARSLGLVVVGFCGFAGGELRAHSDHAVVVDASSIQLVEDVHMALAHAVAVSIHARFRELSTDANGALPAVFVDRDGVINTRRRDHVRSWEQFHFAPGAIEGLRELSASGRRIFVVTNQAVIGRDGLDPRTVDEIHARMLTALAEHGVAIEAVLLCPHDPRASCGCRKPRPGLLLQAAERYHVDLSRSVLVGDSESDLAAARAAGCRALLVGAAPSRAGVPAAADLLDAVHRDLIG